MTTTTPFTRTPNPSPATPERVAEVLAEPGFGRFFTDHMATVRWQAGLGYDLPADRERGAFPQVGSADGNAGAAR